MHDRNKITTYWSRCVSELHGEKYKILEIYPICCLVCWKPAHAVEAYRDSGEALCSKAKGHAHRATPAPLHLHAQRGMPT